MVRLGNTGKPPGAAVTSWCDDDNDDGDIGEKCVYSLKIFSNIKLTGLARVSCLVESWTYSGAQSTDVEKTRQEGINEAGKMK